MPTWPMIHDIGIDIDALLCRRQELPKVVLRHEGKLNQCLDCSVTAVRGATSFPVLR
jgi:hypothetical protein